MAINFPLLLMVREIVSIQVGQCGNEIGSRFWSTLFREHDLSPDGSFVGDSDIELEKIKVYFDEVQKEKYVPRSIFVDFDKETLNNALIPFSNSYMKENVIYGQANVHSNWASCYYCCSLEIIDSIIDVVRKKAEKCDSIQGFQLIHSLGGCTGSGLGTLILNQLQNEYSDVTLSTFSVFPSQKVLHSILEPYNCILSLNQLIQTAEQVFYFDNEALYDHCINYQRHSTPSYDDFNYIIKSCMSGATCSLRFPELLNSDLRKISLNLIPYSHLKFLNITYAPSISPGTTHCHHYTANELISILLRNKKEKLLRAAVNFNGYFIQSDVYQNMHIINSHFDSMIKYSICRIPIQGHSKSATLIENSIDFHKLLKRQKSCFLEMFDKRKFIHIFTSEGLEEEEFANANLNVTNIINEYETIYQNEEENIDDDDF